MRKVNYICTDPRIDATIVTDKYDVMCAARRRGMDCTISLDPVVSTTLNDWFKEHREKFWAKRH